MSVETRPSRAPLLEPTHRTHHRHRSRIGALSLVFFGWVVPLLRVSWRKQLGEEDLLPLWWRDDVCFNARRGADLWEQRRGSFKHIFWQTCGGQFLLGGVYRILSDACSLGQPLLLRSFLSDFVQDPSAPWWLGAAYGAALVACSFFAALFDVAGHFIGSRQAVRTETILKTLMFNKALRLSAASRGAFGVGDVLTRMSVDVQRVSDLIPWLHYSYSPFLMLGVALTLLVTQVRLALVFGLAVVLVMMPLAAVVIANSYALEEVLMKRRDERTKLMSEILRAAKGVKASGLDAPLGARVQAVRGKELTTLRHTQYLNALQGFFWSAIPPLLSTAVFASYILLPPHLACGSSPPGLSHCPITPAVAFSTLLLLRLLHEPLMIMPYIVSELLNAAVSLRRIRRLLLADDAPVLAALTATPAAVAAAAAEELGTAPLLAPDAAARPAAAAEEEPGEPDPDGRSVVLRLHGASFSWHSATKLAGGQDAEPKEGQKEGESGREGGVEAASSGGGSGDEPNSPTTPATSHLAPSGLAARPSLPALTDGKALEAVSLSVREGELIAVIGEVGSGKTALLLAMLGELVRTEGGGSASAVCDARQEVAYAPQEAVIASGTVRENILYGRRFDASRYAAVLKACALETDLAQQLGGGDLTRVGEKGVTLSGGQRQRVALARACYSPAPILLLDDPLSAVDRAIAHHLYRHVLRGWLRGRTVVCVTHALAFVSGFDRVLVMQHGRIGLTGTVRQLAEQGLDLEELVAGTAAPDSAADGVDQAQGGSGAPSAEAAAEAAAVEAVEEVRLKQVELAGDEEDATAIAGAEDEREEDEEERASGAVKCAVLGHYVKGSGGALVAVPFVLCFLVQAALERGADLWLGLWSSGEADDAAGAGSPRSRVEELQPLYLYLGLSLGSAGMTMLILFLAAHTSWRASGALHAQLLDAVLGARQAFFDATAVGRILNRFTRDTNTIDEQVGWTLFHSVLQLLELLSMLGVLVLVTRTFALAALPLLLLFVQIGRAYRPAGRELERLVAVRNSPLFQLFTEALHGAPLIRAARLTSLHERRYRSALLRAERARFSRGAVQRWLDLSVQLLGSCMVALVVAFAVATRATEGGGDGPGESGSGGIGMLDSPGEGGGGGGGDGGGGGGGGGGSSSSSGGLIGLALSYGLGIAYALQGALQVVLRLEIDLVSVERNLQYCEETPQEEPRRMRITGGGGGGAAVSLRRRTNRRSARVHNVEPAPLCDAWPDAGRVAFVDVTLRYRPELPPALRGVSFSVEAGERLGVVGRSGSGKSSLVSALLRLVEVENGAISVDGVDVRSVPLARLRAGIAVVMQDAVMFSGDLRYNLDPARACTDEALTRALRRVRLCAEADDAAEKLKEAVGEGGDNWSAGQRQLICLARAILRGAKVLVCDEATSSIDAETDGVVQGVLRERRATMLVIAHRLETILDSDRVLLMDAGAVAEEGPPAELAAREGGRFAALLASRGEGHRE